MKRELSKEGMEMEAKTKDLWVYVETLEDGSPKNVGLELLTPGRELAAKQGGALTAVVIGYQTDESVKEAVAHGADKVLVIDGPEYQVYSTDAYTYALCALIEKHGPASVLIGATNNGRDLGPGYPAVSRADLQQIVRHWILTRKAAMYSGPALPSAAT